MIRLHRPAFSAAFTVENSGLVYGGEVSQKNNARSFLN